jgi:asparagine synthase (glutamine-hydrolysing)
VDSSATVALMAGLMDRPVVTNSIGFDVSKFDEREYAQQIASRFSTEHHEKVLSPRAGHVVNQLSWFYDEPFGDSSAVPTYYLCGMTRDQVTVALSGDGGDELFAGYTHYPESMWAASIRARVPELLRSAARVPLKHLFQVSRYHPSTFGYNALAWRVVHDRDRSAYFNLLPQPWRFAEMLNRDLLRTLRGYDPFDSVRALYDKSGSDDGLARMQYADIKAYLCDDILVKVDRASMAHALEVRCPFLDHRVVSYAARIPPNLNLDGAKSKVTLKRAISSLIPPEFFERPKQGFAIPIAEWFRTALREPAARLFFDRRGGESGLLDPAELRRRWWEHQRGLVNHGTPFWNGMMFELWYQRFIERSAPEVEPTAPMREYGATVVL